MRIGLNATCVGYLRKRLRCALHPSEAIPGKLDTIAIIQVKMFQRMRSSLG